MLLLSDLEFVEFDLAILIQVPLHQVLRLVCREMQLIKHLPRFLSFLLFCFRFLWCEGFFFRRLDGISSTMVVDFLDQAEVLLEECGFVASTRRGGAVACREGTCKKSKGETDHGAEARSHVRCGKAILR